MNCTRISRRLKSVFSVLILAGLLCLVSVLSGSTITIDFEDPGLAADSYYNGSDNAGGFMSGPANFNNSYNADYAAWEGWSLSSVSDTVTAGWGNQYAAFPGSGAGGSSTYAVGYSGFTTAPNITFSSGTTVNGAWFSNTTYAGLTMTSGDDFSKQFGGVDGNDADWFRLTITGKDGSDQATGTVDYYLSDFRFTDNSQDYISNSWVWVDLRGLGSNVTSLEFSLASSDNGDFGMNTPAYFAMDGLQVIPEPSTWILGFLGLGIIWIYKLRQRRN